MGRNRRVPDVPYQAVNAAGFEATADVDGAVEHDAADMIGKLDEFAKFDAGKGAMRPCAVQLFSGEDCAAVVGVYLPSEQALISDSTHPKAASVLLELADALRVQSTRLVLNPADKTFGASMRNAMYLGYQIRSGAEATELCNRTGVVVMEHLVTLIDDEDFDDALGEEQVETTDAPSDDDDDDDDLGFTPPFTYRA